MHVPPERPGLVPRGALLERLSQTEDRQLVVVEAPAGYGKTTLLAQWAHRDSERSFAWLSLDAAENDQVMLWRYVFAAIRRVVPGLAEGAWAKLHGASPDLERVVIPGLLNALLDLTERLVLVLDDFHVIENPAAHTSIESLIGHLPRSTEIVLATRTAPPLALSSLVARGQVLEIGREELAFDRSEIGQALSLSGPTAGEDAAAVFRRTEGWPAGVYLAGEGLRRAAPAALAASVVDIQLLERYVDEEMLSKLPADQRDFLVRTSILDELNGDLCDHVTRGSASEARLVRATRSNLLISPVDADGEWVRCHEVLRNTLQRMLRTDDRFNVSDLHSLAHDWFVEHGFVSKAVDHAVAAGDYEAAAELIWVHWFGYWATGRLETARRWLTAVPESVVNTDPPLLVVAAWISAFTGDGAAMRRFAEAAVNAGFDEPAQRGPLSYSSLLTVLRANAWPTGVTDALRLAEAAYDREEPGSPSRRFVAVLFGNSRISTGDYDGGRAVLEQDVVGAGPPDTLSCYAAGLLALSDVLRGRWEEAAERAAATIQVIRDSGLDGDFSSGAAYVAAAVTAARAGQAAKARQYLRGVDAMEHAISPGSSFDGFLLHTFAAEAELLLGNVAAARRHAGLATDYLDRVGDGGVYAARLEAVAAQIDAHPVAGQPAPDEGPDPLTVREQQILRLLSSELTLREIGRELYISRNTTKTHVSRIYKKLRVSSRADAVTRARELDLI